MRQLELNPKLLTVLAAVCLAACARPSAADAGTHGHVKDAKDAASLTPEVAAPAAQPATSAVYTEKDTAISATHGSEFTIAIKDNTGVPYRWTLDSTTPAGSVELLEQHYQDQPPEGCPDCVGAGGMRLFRLKASAAGQTTLSFGYHRVQSQDPPEKQHSVTVTVSP